MGILTEPLGLPIFSKRPYKDYFDAERVGFLDLETTGLSPKHHQIILAGIVVPGNGSYIAKQYFAETPEEEIDVLRGLFMDLRDLDAVVTFNGRHFDIPFLEKRLAELGVSEELYEEYMPYNLDLYQLAKKYSDLRKFVPNMKQKTLEAYLGLWQNRSDEIDGGESVRLYNEWVSTGNTEAREKVLLHNFDDIVQLTRLMKVISRTNFHEAMAEMGFPRDGYCVDSVKEKKGMLVISGRQGENGISYERFGENGDYVLFHSGEKTFEIQKSVVRREGIAFLDLTTDCAESQASMQEVFDGDPSYIEGCVVIETEGRIDYRARNKAAMFLVERVRHDGL